MNKPKKDKESIKKAIEAKKKALNDGFIVFKSNENGAKNI